MINGIDNLGIGKSSELAGLRRQSAGRRRAARAFADTLKKSVDEVSRLQQDASKAVDDVADRQNRDWISVMTAVEKSDLAFKTLLAIRAKLMDAYEEIKGIADLELE